MPNSRWNAVSDICHECTETKLQAQQLEPTSGDPDKEREEPQKYENSLNVKKKATASTPQMANTLLNQSENVAAGGIFSHGTDQPVTEQDNKEEGAYGSPQQEGKFPEVQEGMENANLEIK